MGRDAIDLLCERWARVRRELVGLRKPALSSQLLGGPHCTLDTIRRLHDGAQFNPPGTDRHLPEFPYVGDLFIANQLIRAMPETMRLVLDLHYVLERPRQKSLRAQLVGMSRDRYYDQLGLAKARLDGGMAGWELSRQNQPETVVLGVRLRMVPAGPGQHISSEFSATTASACRALADP